MACGGGNVTNVFIQTINNLHINIPEQPAPACAMAAEKAPAAKKQTSDDAKKQKQSDDSSGGNMTPPTPSNDTPPRETMLKIRKNKSKDSSDLLHIAYENYRWGLYSQEVSEV